MNCAVVGAVLAEISLRARIDTDVESLVVVDESETGNPALDPILKQIADEPSPRNAQYWIERLAVHAESVIDLIPNRLVDLKILIASVYLGDALSFAVYAMASQPALYERIRSEADALFDKGDPAGEDFTPSAIDVTHRFLMECLRVYPIVPMSMRDVMNTCGVEGYELPVGSRICIARTASHYMDDVFPEPFSFDIDRYLPPRSEHRSPGYAPHGLGTHRCLGSRWMDLQVAVNVLMIAHYFRIEVPRRTMCSASVRCRP